MYLRHFDAGLDLLEGLLQRVGAHGPRAAAHGFGGDGDGGDLLLQGLGPVAVAAEAVRRGVGRGQGQGADASDGKGPQTWPQRRLGRRLPKRLGAVTVGDKCHERWHLASGGQWLGIDWAPWRRGGGGGNLPPFQCIPGRGGGGGQTWATNSKARPHAQPRRARTQRARGGLRTNQPTGAAERGPSGAQACAPQHPCPRPRSVPHTPRSRGGTCRRWVRGLHQGARVEHRYATAMVRV